MAMIRAAMSNVLKTPQSLAKLITKNFNMQSKDVSCQADYWDFLWPELRFRPKQETNSEIMSQVFRFIRLHNSKTGFILDG